MANAVSMMMPHAEPYVVGAIRKTLPSLDPDLADETARYLAQEQQHHRQHRRFNDRLIAEAPYLARFDRVVARAFRILRRWGSDRFAVAFAAGFETVAYASARWVEARLGQLFTSADPTSSSIFLWHLAEEVEHKTVAHDVYWAAHGSRRTYIAGLVTSMVLLGLVASIGTIQLLWHQRRLHRPVAHWRMARWTVSFLFELLPAMAVSALPGHHPSDLADPPFFELWLRDVDPEGGTVPLWTDLDVDQLIDPNEVRSSLRTGR